MFTSVTVLCDEATTFDVYDSPVINRTNIALRGRSVTTLVLNDSQVEVLYEQIVAQRSRIAQRQLKAKEVEESGLRCTCPDYAGEDKACEVHGAAAVKP